MSLFPASLIAAAFAAAPPSPAAAADPDFGALWTPWHGANEQSIQAETARTGPAAPGPTGAMVAGSPALGERVGEVVRDGDCAEGERLARLAGDFPLLDAVRNHCRGAVSAVSHDRVRTPQASRSR